MVVVVASPVSLSVQSLRHPDGHCSATFHRQRTGPGSGGVCLSPGLQRSIMSGTAHTYHKNQCTVHPDLLVPPLLPLRVVKFQCAHFVPWYCRRLGKKHRVGLLEHAVMERQDSQLCCMRCYRPHGPMLFSHVFQSVSIQECDVGYTRTGSGLYLGTCERCDCNGHASGCDLETGACLVSRSTLRL